VDKPDVGDRAVVYFRRWYSFTNPLRVLAILNDPSFEAFRTQWRRVAPAAGSPAARRRLGGQHQDVEPPHFFRQGRHSAEMVRVEVSHQQIVNLLQPGVLDGGEVALHHVGRASEANSHS
jgi:hypothetical protein